MGQLVGAYGVSHTAMIVRKYDPEQENQRRVHEAFAKLRDEIKALNPDTIVVVGSEHLLSFFYKNYPQYCVMVGKKCEGWGDGGIPSKEVAVSDQFAQFLLNTGVESGFDFSWSTDLKLDHGFMMPLHLLTPDMDYPIVPIFQNASTPPLPTFKRAKQLGELIRQVIDQRPKHERVVMFGTGGLSHWVGTPEMGQINEEFDQNVLRRFEQGDLEWLSGLQTDEVMTQAGNGAQEIRNWVTVMAAAQGSANVLLYEPVAEWSTGISLAKFSIERGVSSS